MSDECDERDLDDAGDASGSSEDEKDGLGLTEEFARIEQEIEREVSGPAAAGDEAPERVDDGVPDGPPPLRWEDTDSSEWVAPVEARAGQETDEWSDDEATDAGEVASGGPVLDPSPPTQGGSLADQPADGLVEGPAEEGDAEGAADGAAAEERREPERVAGADAEGQSEDDDEADPDDEPAQTPAGGEPAIEHTIIRPRPLAPRPPAAVALGAGGGLIDDADLNVKTPSLWWRFLTGSILIVVATATAVALSSLLFLTEVAAKLQPIPGIQEKLDVLENPGDPQTILIVGSDERSETPGDPGRSDTTMLLRVDAEAGVLSLFSLPRDLKVDIPNYGEGRLNEAFTVGGVQKTLRTVQNLTGLEVNHVVNVDFQGFADAVNAIECVYVDIDRKYFNDNSQALSASDQYAEIDINAGYQRLCGLDALAYVRYRHEDNDIVRAARQQDFLREARQKIQPQELIFSGRGNELIDIFTKYTSSDVDEAAQVIGILQAFIAVRDVPIQQVSFEGDLADVDENGVAYVTASDEQIETAVDEFLGGGTTAGVRGGDEAGEKKDAGKSGGGRRKGGGKGGKGKEKDPMNGATVISTEDVAAAQGGIDKFAAFGRTSARRLEFPVYVPTAVVPGSTYSSDSRQYEIKDIDDEKQDAYKMVIAYQTPSTLTEYYGIEGTTWSDPPILEKKSESREIDGRTYDLFYDGDRLRLVAWHEGGNSYWVSNTLAQTLEEADMLAIATSVDEAHG